MTLEEAISNFENDYGEPDEALEATDIFDTYSGGVRKKGAPIPALYASKETAIEEWLRALYDVAVEWGPPAAMSLVVLKEPRPKYRWIEKPVLDRYQITMADAKQTHRLTEDRFTVMSRVALAPG